MSIKIVVEKAGQEQVQESDLAIGIYYRVGRNSECEIYRRVAVADRVDCFFYTVASDGHSTAYSGNGKHHVYPCDSDGKLLEPAGVEKVRVDSLKSGNTCVDSSGAVRILTEKSKKGKGFDAIGIDNKNIWHGVLYGHEMVTPVTITEIHYREGVER